MKGFRSPVIAGGLITSLSLIVLISWYFHAPSMASLYPGYVNPFNAALGLFLIGLIFLFSGSHSRFQTLAYYGVGFSLILLGGLSLSQSLLGYSLGLDELFVKVWMPDNFHHGRMPENTAFAFIASGLILISLSHLHLKYIRLSVHLLTLIIFMLSVSSLFSYMFNMQSLSVGNYGKQMSLLSAVGFLFTSLGFWSLYSSYMDHPLYNHEKEDKKIRLLGTFITVFFALLLGFICYAIFLQEQMHLFHDLREKAFLFIILTMVAGMFLLYWQVFSLISSIIYSKKDLLSINEHLKESENKFRSAFDYSAIGMALISTTGHFLKVNQALCNILGYTENELLKTDMKKIIHADEFKKNMESMQELLEGHIKYYHCEQHFVNKSGENIWVLVNTSLIQDAMGKNLYFISQIQNISAEKNAEEKLKQMAYHDPLTGLANRNKLEIHLHELIMYARRHHPEFAIIFLDLDNFKNINDTVGHDSGDLLLQIIGERLKTTVRDSDLICRLGGDEFVLVVANIKKVEAVALIAQKILHNLLKPIVIKGHEIYTTTSIGISIFPFDGQDIQTLLKSADLALYRAKEQGRNNYQFCTPEMTEKALVKMKRQNALSHALVKDEFILYYQPKMDLKTNKINGVEALLRWKNSEYGKVVTTEEIIALSEESGLIIALSEWILKTACKQAKKWHAAGFIPLSVSINLSPRQFKQPSFVQSILQVLNDVDFPADCLELEITEGLIMQDPENTLRILQEFKKIGILLSIDDFGTGYSSMSYLRRFSVDKIKIDKTFLHRIPNDELNISIVTATIAMAQKLGIKVIAEGIEKKEQYEFLLKENCNEMQGYYLSRPLPVDKMTAFLNQSVTGVNFSNLSKNPSLL